MNTNFACKTFSLLITAFVICLYLFGAHDYLAVGIYSNCALSCRILYPLFHANILHTVLNTWCLLSVVFIYDISLCRLIFSYFIAATIPSMFLSNVPTIGLSGVVFALFGSISFDVKRKLYYQLWMLAYLVAGFLFPNTNALVHLYCYIGGFAVALLNKPIKIADNGNRNTQHN